MNQSYPTHPSYPTQPQYSQAPPQMSYQNIQNMQPHMGGPTMMPADLAMLAQQGYQHQQQQLAHAQMMAGMMARQNANPTASGSGTPSHKKKKVVSPAEIAVRMILRQEWLQPRPSPQAQMLPRHTQHLAPPQLNEHYIKHAMSGPGDVEPWADGLDEVDPREMAMGRFRARQEILAEVFGPEAISVYRPGTTALYWSLMSEQKIYR